MNDEIAGHEVVVGPYRGEGGGTYRLLLNGRKQHQVRDSGKWYTIDVSYSQPALAKAISEDTRKWAALKKWLVDVKTNGELADDNVSAMRDLVWLIEKDIGPDPGPHPLKKEKPDAQDA